MQIFNYYLRLLNYEAVKDYLEKYINCPSLKRLSKVSYFCAMNYASKNIYNFKENISRLDHSISTALLSYRFSNNKTTMISGLIHDISTPASSHVVDYMNKDYSNQESTEEYTQDIIKNDIELISLLKKDNINIDEVIDFKSNSIVDNERPKLCSDRFDGIILPGYFWVKVINKEDIKDIVDDLDLFINEYNEKEIGFKSIKIAKKVVEVSNCIDMYCHSNEDNYMMELLSSIIKELIDKKFIAYKDLYVIDEDTLFNIINTINDSSIQRKYYIFKNIKREEIEDIDMPYIKKKNINPLVNGKRLL